MGDSQSKPVKTDTFQARADQDDINWRMRQDNCHKAAQEIVNAINDTNSSMRSKIDEDLKKESRVYITPESLPEYSKLFTTLFNCRYVPGMDEKVNGQFKHIRVGGQKVCIIGGNCDDAPGIEIHYNQDGKFGSGWPKFYN